MCKLIEKMIYKTVNGNLCRFLFRGYRYNKDLQQIYPTDSRICTDPYCFVVILGSKSCFSMPSVGLFFYPTDFTDLHGYLLLSSNAWRKSVFFPCIPWAIPF